MPDVTLTTEEVRATISGSAPAVTLTQGTAVTLTQDGTETTLSPSSVSATVATPAVASTVSSSTISATVTTGGATATDFLGLSDTPNTYAGAGGYAVAVNAGATGLEFIAFPASGVTSVALSLPSIFTVSGSPVTGAGTLTGTLATQTANTIFAGPTTGSAAAPAFRALVAGDLPSISSGLSGVLPAANGGTGTANSGDLAWPSGGGTAALLATANVFTAQQSVLGTTQEPLLYGRAADTIKSRHIVAADGNHQWRVNMAADNTTRDNATRPAWAFVINPGTGSDEFAVYNWAVGESFREYLGVRTTGSVLGKSAEGATFAGSDFAGRLNVFELDTATSGVSDHLTLSHNSTNTPQNGFGSRVRWRLQSSTTIDQTAFTFDIRWADATHASRKGRITANAWDATTARELWRGESSGSAAMIGFLGATAIARQTVAANATDLATAITLVNDIKAKLQSFGLFN